MRLTKGIKAALVRAILDDVPSVDYKQQAEDLARKALEQRMPNDVLRFAKKYPDRVHDGYFSFKSGDGYGAVRVAVCIPGATSQDSLDGDAKQPIRELLVKAELQEGQHDALERSLRLALEGIHTRQSFVDAYPEFAKYLPEEPEKIRHVLVTTGLVDALTAAGWPKAGGQ